ncbi:hypothetical protein Xsto_00088 [Xenorhabdus stockiae]|uniref:Uncharacterized protein n=1 Tax=Xenorhabdus stockiae TaxID=351614 RepID=A0A2D0KWN3_9GAMM|nr:hypothetical protein [Xenorhabdus stockiae]PHM67798.1 hypothetical protein Xsto_00088 [Xenorhabdus stockiae]
MQQTNLSIWRYLISRDVMLNMIIPIILYHVAFSVGGVSTALLLTTIYSVILKIISKTQSLWVVIALLLVSGLSHYLYIHGYTLFDKKLEEVFGSISSAASLVAVFCFYSLIGKPAAKTMAEQAMPGLKTISVYGKPIYDRVWHEVSIAWILVYLSKAIGIYLLANRAGFPIDTMITFCGTPLTILMILFSFYWPRYRWRSYRKKQERNKSE